MYIEIYDHKDLTKLKKNGLYLEQACQKVYEISIVNLSSQNMNTYLIQAY